MLKLSVSLAFAAVFSAGAALGGEIPPFYPERKTLPPMNTAISPDKIKIKLKNDRWLEPGKFVSSRSLNGVWRISGLENAAAAFTENAKGYEKPDFNDSGWDRIKVPMNWYEKYPVYDRKKSYVQGYYRHSFKIDAGELTNRRCLLHFEFIGYEGILWINGKRVGNHHGDFTPWTVDISNYVRPGANTLMMQVITDFGNAVGSAPRALHTYGAQWSWRNIKGGIWGNVELRFEPPIRFEQIYVIPDTATDTLEIRARLDNTLDKTVRADLSLAVSTALKKEPNRLNALTEPMKISLKPGINVVKQKIKLNRPQRWSPDHPYLYFCTAFLENQGDIISARAQRFGFRSFRIKDGRFHLNDKRIYLFGENIPSTYGGHATRDTDKEAEALYRRLAGFKSLGCNIIRTAHMPMMKKGLDIADEIGLMIYDEWSWSFTSAIDPEIFSQRNEKEFLEWIDRDFNHPSVVMWSCGNEVRHAGNPTLRALLNRQVEQIHKHDWQKRPAGVFSGSASWRSFGAERLVTDFLDHHSYVGNGEAPWTCWSDNFNEYYSGTLEQYGRKKAGLGMPYIIWECIGFSWGKKHDSGFKPNDAEQYAAYVEKPSSWGNPNGIGYAGSIGLAASLDPNRGMPYAQARYGHRLLEKMRLDPRIDGFAPWFQNSNLVAAALWNQPVLIGLKNSCDLPPQNVFSAEKTSLDLFVVNSGREEFPGGNALISIYTEKGENIPVKTLKLSSVKEFERSIVPVTLTIPEHVDGNVQLRIQLTTAEKEYSRNFYPVFIQNRKALKKPIRSVYHEIAILDVGNAKDAEKTAAVLKSYGVKFEIINALSIPEKYRMAIIPAGIENKNPLRLNRSAISDWLKNKGGTLLVLEQNPQAGKVIAGLSANPGANSMIDLVHPAHPVFTGLSPANFDTWNNPDHGYVITTSLFPFLKNAIAARCPMLGSSGVSNAIIEAKVGKGRIFWSQLAAVRLHHRDSAAARYLRNVFSYMLSGNVYGKILELDTDKSGLAQVDPARIDMIDLRPYLNRDFADERATDGKGGWTDQGNNDMRHIPLGVQNAAGIPFNIIDPAQNHGKGCIVLRGTGLPEAPTEVTGIKIQGKYRNLFFLHTAAWSGGKVGMYRIHYSDGTMLDYPLTDGVNIGDWWMMSFLTHATLGIICPNATKTQVGSYVATWANPHPGKEIASVDFLSSSSPLIQDINFQTGRRAIPILIAISGERADSRTISISDSIRRPGAGNEATINELKTLLPDGSTGNAWRVNLPAKEEKGKPPYAIFRFDASKGSLADYRKLSFWIKPESSGVLEVQLPQKDWKRTMRKKLIIEGNGWRCLTVDLDEAGRQNLLKAGATWRGELFFFNGKRPNTSTPNVPSPLIFLVCRVTLD